MGVEVGFYYFGRGEGGSWGVWGGGAGEGLEERDV